MEDIFTGIYKKIIVVFIVLIFILSLVIIVVNRLNLTGELERFFGVDENMVRLISHDTQWSYIEEGLNPSVGNVWTTEKYNSEHWKKDYGPFGKAVSQDVTTQLKLIKHDDKAIASYFFRYDFVVDEALFDSGQMMEGMIEYNDAAIIYLNGSIVFAGNIPENGYITNQEYGASEKLDDIRQDKFYISDLSALKKGKNIIAVEIHQYNDSSENIYFNFKELNVLKTKTEMADVNIDTLMVEAGDSEQDVNLSWITEDSGYYQVEYVDQTSYKVNNDFEQQSEILLMGRQSLSDEKGYIHRVNINRLKNDTEYAYRIRKIATDEVSKIDYFKTGKKVQFQGAFITDLQDLDSNNLYSLTQEMDFLIAPVHLKVSMDSQEGVKEAVYDWRKQSVLKRIPTLPVQGDFKNNTIFQQYFEDLYRTDAMDKLGNCYLVYQDVLLIYLNQYTFDNTAYKTFLEETLKQYKEKRSVVIVQDQELFNDALQQYDIDYIVSVYNKNLLIDFNYRTIDFSFLK